MLEVERRTREAFDRAGREYRDGMTNPSTTRSKTIEEARKAVFDAIDYNIANNGNGWRTTMAKIDALIDVVRAEAVELVKAEAAEAKRRDARMVTYFQSNPDLVRRIEARIAEENESILSGFGE